MKVARGGAWNTGMLLLGALTAAGTVYFVWRKLAASEKKTPCHETCTGANGASDRSSEQATISEEQRVNNTQRAPDDILKECDRLKGAYSEMARKFLEEGLDVDFVSSAREYFSGLEPLDVTSSPGSRVVEPKRYADTWPGGALADDAVRLIVLPLNPDSRMSSVGESVTRDVLKQLSFIKDVFRNVRSGYHITIYHTSKMMYPCPDATHSTGGVDESVPPHERPGPTQDYMDKELQICKDAASACGHIELKFERVVFTDTGTLLLTWVDTSGNIERLRSRFREEFPGALRNPQSNIVHVSLLRVLCVQQLDVYIRQKIDAVCVKWTSRLKGTAWEPDTLMHVCEECFSTIEGQHRRFELQ